MIVFTAKKPENMVIAAWYVGSVITGMLKTEKSHILFILTTTFAQTSEVLASIAFGCACQRESHYWKKVTEYLINENN